AGVACAVEGPEEARLALRGPDHRLRVHAGDGPGERPCRRLRRARRGRTGAMSLGAARRQTDMGTIAVHEFISLDGVYENPAWTFDYGFDPKMSETLAAITNASSAIMLGRRTYEMFYHAW